MIRLINVQHLSARYGESGGNTPTMRIILVYEVNGKGNLFILELVKGMLRAAVCNGILKLGKSR
jgi:hypothetical protein